MAGPPVRLGLIGAGPWGRNLIAAARRLEGMALTRVASSNPETAALVGSGCTIDADWRDVVTADDVDGVLVTTPPSLHAEMAGAALKAGKAVFIEKPVTLDPGEAHNLLALAERAGRPVLVDHIHLYSPAYRTLKDRALGAGHIHFIRSAGGNRGPFRADTSPLWDYGAHDIAMCLDLLHEKPVSVSARREESEEASEGYGENLALRLTFSDGVVAEIRVGNLMEVKRRFFAVYFDDSTMVYDDLMSDKLVIEPRTEGLGCIRRDVEIVPLPPTPPLDAALETFARAIAENDTNLRSLRLAVDVVDVIAECQQALETG